MAHSPTLKHVPPPGLDGDEVRRATLLLERVAADRSLLDGLPEPEMKALLAAVGRVAMPERNAKARHTKAMRRRSLAERREHDRALTAKTEIRALRKDAVFTPPVAPRLAASTSAEPERVLREPRTCYVCKAEFLRLHFFYDSMCPECAELNYRKRFQTAPLRGKVALITGARVKIGYQASLMLLRSGARVIATTRFPQDAAQRYAREPDFSSWSQRLHVHGLDLRHAPSVEVFARHIEQTHDRLDILINNAAQTVRRPPGFYAHLLPTETMDPLRLPAEARALLDGHRRLVEAVSGRATVQPRLTADELALSWHTADAALGIHASAALSQVPYALETDAEVKELFPAGALDQDLQQVDLRQVNSWRLTLSEVQLAEMLEVHLVNAVAPFILCGRLKALMLRDRSSPGHVVNVSAMEGSFSRGTKTDKHPHTNMAKAALNMLTLTSAKEFAQSGIYMNAVDTGWVTDEDPAHHAQRKQQELDFQPPLDVVDGAARVVDPVFVAENTGELVFGRFFKDYRPTSW